MAKEKKILKDHNGGLTGDIFSKHVREQSKLDKEEADLKARRKVADKRAEDDGVNVKDMKDALKRKDVNVALEIERLNRVKSYLDFLRSPLGEAMNYLDEPGSTVTMTEEQRLKLWRDEGFRAGQSAKNRDECPHDPNSEAGREWMAGYEEGQAENAAGISDGKGNVVEMPKRRPGRKAKDSAPANDAPPPPPENVPSDEAPDAPADEDGEQGSDGEEEAPPAPPTSDAEWDAAAPKA